MTTFQHGNEFIKFEYLSSFDGSDFETFYNVIEIHDGSEKVMENITIQDGAIYFDGYVFPTMFKTEGVEHTFSINGQFHWLMNDFIRRLTL